MSSISASYKKGNQGRWVQVKLQIKEDCTHSGSAIKHAEADPFQGKMFVPLDYAAYFI